MTRNQAPLVCVSAVLAVGYLHFAAGGCADSTDVGVPVGSEEEAGDGLFDESDDTSDTSGDVAAGSGDVGEDTSGATSGAATSAGATSGGQASSGGSVSSAAASSGASSSGGGNPGDCCSAAMAPGCGDPGIEQCVCAQDDYCCMTAWDDQCVGEVDTFGCGDCGGGSSSGSPPQPSECCMETGMPGCGDPNIEQCVCSLDPYCCDVTWDQFCAAEVEGFGCGSCQ